MQKINRTSSKAFPGTEIFPSTNTGELKNLIPEGTYWEMQVPVSKNLMTARKDREDDEQAQDGATNCGLSHRWCVVRAGNAQNSHEPIAGSEGRHQAK